MENRSRFQADYIIEQDDIFLFKEVLEQSDWKGDFLVAMLSLNSLCIYQKLKINNNYPFANTILYPNNIADKNWSLLPAFSIPFNILPTINQLSYKKSVQFLIDEETTVFFKKDCDNISIFVNDLSFKTNSKDFIFFIKEESKKITQKIITLLPELLNDKSFYSKCLSLEIINIR